MTPLVFTISLPEYKPDEKPDVLKIGPKLDGVLEKNFHGKSVVIRCISTQDHTGTTLDELADIILKTGTDKYDASRKGVGYHVGSEQGKHIDFFGTPAEITDHTDIFTLELLNDFYYGAQGDRGYHLRIDLVMIYDPTKLTIVEHLYGDDIDESDGFVFSDPKHKVDALLGIIKILS